MFDNFNRIRWSVCRLIACILLIGVISRVAVSSDLSATYSWKPVRIGAGGWMRGMAVSPKYPNIRYARGDVDNLYRWDQSSGSWIPLKVAGVFPPSVTAVPAGGGCGAIALDPSDPKKVLCAFTFYRSADMSASFPSIKLNVYRSSDGGKSFKAGNLALEGSTENETHGERLAIDPNNDDVVYFGSPKNGLWRTADGGALWTIVSGNGAPAPSSNAELPRFDPGAGTTMRDGQKVSKRVYLTMAGGSTLMSDDGGSSWRSISAGAAIDGKPGFATVDRTGNLWVAQDGSAVVWRYSRSGGWWQGTTPCSNVDGIAVDPHNAARVFVIGSGGQIARSIDGGVSWISLGGSMTFSDTQPIHWLRPTPGVRPRNHYISDGGMYFDGAGRLWVPCGNDGILTTQPDDATDTAAHPPSWSSLSMGIEEMVAELIALPPGGVPILTVEDETLFTTTDPDTFTARHYNIDLWDNNDGLSSGQDVSDRPNQPKLAVMTSANLSMSDAGKYNYSGYSADGGLTWHRFSSIVRGSHPGVLYLGLIAVSRRPNGHENDAPGHDNIVWVGSSVSAPQSAAPFYSFDGGATWAQTRSFDACAWRVFRRCRRQ